ncbi:50S ribosomal protein L18Ae [Candidatus Gugararchaeum adminiculabundum]|nr:50S ribosomal protein L18Ae [Candidatus Gugararchaeum adminiculabundum]
MAKFVLTGQVKLGAKTRKFEKEIDALNENLAKERLYSVFGSVYRVKRARIKIDSVQKA